MRTRAVSAFSITLRRTSDKRGDPEVPGSFFFHHINNSPAGERCLGAMSAKKVSRPHAQEFRVRDVNLAPPLLRGSAEAGVLPTLEVRRTGSPRGTGGVREDDTSAELTG